MVVLGFVNGEGGSQFDGTKLIHPLLYTKNEMHMYTVRRLKIERALFYNPT